jgi:Carboxypeptidase regulatory-like domain
MNRLGVALLILQSTFPQKAVELKGKVVDADGRPSASANIQIVKDDDPDANSMRNVESDENGAFDLKDVEPGRYRVYVWKPSAGVPFTRYLLFAPGGPPLQVILTSSSPSSTVTLKLPPPYGTIQGRVTDEITKKPVEHVRIRLELNDDRRVYFEAGASDGGRFSFLIPPRPVRVAISAPGYVPWSYKTDGGSDALLLHSSDNVDLDVRLKRVVQSP